MFKLLQYTFKKEQLGIEGETTPKTEKTGENEMGETEMGESRGGRI